LHQQGPQHNEKDAQGTGADEVIFVGDSEVDAATAEAANVRFVLFTSGYLKGSAQNIKSAAHFADFARLPGLVNRISTGI